jgi:hypothetical protein
VSHYFLNPTARSVPVHPGLFEAEEYHEVTSFFRGMPSTALRHLTALAAKLGVGDIDRSRVFVINTEGATDPQLYLEVTGRHASSVCTTSH